MAGRWLLLLFGAALMVRLPLVAAYPAVYGGDSVARLARSDELVLAYQLPLPQLLVFLARAAFPDPILARTLFAVIGALVPVALARAMKPSLGLPAALAAGALAALHPLLLYYSLVPYQESLMLALLLEGGVALQERREIRAGLLVGLACLCRYEAWIAAGLVIVARRQRLRAVLIFGAAPLLWLILWRGLSPGGTYVLDLDAEASRFSRLAFLATKLREYSGWWALGLACLGASVAVGRRSRALGWGALFVVSMLAAVVAAGHEFPPGSGQVSERLAHVPALAACALAGLALGEAAERGARSRRSVALVAVPVVVLWLGQSWVRLARAQIIEANRDPALVLAMQVAQLASRQLGYGGRLAVLAPPVPKEAVQDYVDKVGRSGGDVARAREIARGLARHSPDTDRVAANLARPPHTVVEDAAGAALVAVFDDGPPPAAGALGARVARFESGTRGVTVYRNSMR